MKKHICPMCGDPLKKGSTACSCGYKESLTDRELLRRLARWDRLRTVCSVMLVLGFVVGGVVWWKSGDIRWGLLALFILLAVGIIGLCRCDSRQRKLIWEQMGDLFRSETEQAFGPDTKLPELVIDEADIRRSQMIDRHWEEFQIKNYRQLALESTLPVMDLPMDINVRDLNALRRSYLVSLRYLQGIIEALRRCGALFAEHEKEQTNG